MTSESRSEFERTFLARARARGFANPERLLGWKSSGQGYVLPSTESAWVGWCWAIESQRMTSVGVGDGTRRAVVNWNELSRHGVLVRINEMLRAEGLAVMRVVETGTSPGAMVLEVSDGQ